METQTPLSITIERQPTEERLAALGVFSWPTWGKAVSEFPWVYDAEETCYFLNGEVIVTPDGGEPVQIGQGDLVVFPAGMSCYWKILRTVKKHYSFA